MNVNGVVPALPSAAVTSEIEIDGVPSSFWIVTVPAPLPITPFTGFDSVTVNCSFASFLVSPTTFTVMVCGPLVLGGNVSVPVCCW